MRVLFLVALCLAVAFARQPYSNRSQFQRLLRSLQREQQQQQEQGYCGPRCQRNLFNIDQDEQGLEEEDDEYYQQGQQCSRRQRYGSLNLNDDDNNDEYNEYERECDEDDFQCKLRQRQQEREYEQDETEYTNRYTQYGQQGRRQQQQRHQCQPKYQLLQELEQPNVHLASKLYKQAKQENDDKNTVVSPASLQLALAAIQRGARGHTKRQLQRIVGAGLTKQQIRHAHTALQQSLHGQDPVQRQQTGQQQQAKVKTTTTIVINQRNRAQRQFIQAVQSCLNVQVKKCDFQRQPQQCRQQINRYVAQKTNQKLQQTVPQDAITENTKLVVINTAQVKARWGRQFRQQQQTRHGRFYPLGCQRPKPVQFLQSQGRFQYYEDEQLKVVGVPTQQQELTLYVIVPKNKDGLNQIEKSQIQDGEQLKQLLEQAEQQRQQVRVQLPKFQIKHKLDAKQTLRKEGVQAVFDADEADLSGINGQQQQQERYEQYYSQQDDEQTVQRQQQLHVNKLIHQATIKVDEQGISAARQQHPGQYEWQYESNQYGQEYEPEQYDEETEDEDEQEQQYHRQQLRRQELFDEIFGQQRFGGRRQYRFGRNPYNRRQFQSQYEQDEENEYENEFEAQQYYGQGEKKQVRANRAFAFALKHNPSNQIVLVGRVVDATQKPKQHSITSIYGQRQQGQQTLNGVDQQ
jgi:serpin B